MPDIELTGDKALTRAEAEALVAKPSERSKRAFVSARQKLRAALASRQLGECGRCEFCGVRQGEDHRRNCTREERKKQRDAKYHAARKAVGQQTGVALEEAADMSRGDGLGA